MSRTPANSTGVGNLKKASKPDASAATPASGELALDLGYRTAPGPPEHVPVRIVMAWEHAKDLLTLVDAALKEYEEKIGPIRDFGGIVEDLPEDGK